MSLARRAATAAALLAALTAATPAALAAAPPATGTPVVRTAPVTETAPVIDTGSVPGVGGVPREATRLVLSVGSQTRTAAAVAPRSVTLACDPASGPHPNAQQACDQLAAVDGGFDQLKAARRGMCPMIFAPVTATATGTWQGRPVNWSKEFANGCVLAQRTGDVFQF